MHSCRTEDWDIILLPDPQGGVGNVGSFVMGGFHGPNDQQIHRVYGFVGRDMRLGRRGRIRLEALAGPVIYRLGADHAGVRVLWLPTPDCPQIGNNMTALAFKRRAYWHSNNRNDYVAAVARSLGNQDGEKFIGYGIPFRDGKPVLRHAPDTKIAVLAACTEQAGELHKRLPGWQVLDAVPHNGKKEAGATERDMPGTIITEMQAGKEGLVADVVIRAGGSSGNMCFKGFPPTKNKDKRDAILADFSDTFDRRAIQDAKRRQREYELLGWESEPEHG
jgi:hypothetical protein